MGDIQETREKIENLLSQYPIFEYSFVKPEEIPFSERVRHVCRTECKRYGTSWSCPPAVGDVAECRRKCQTYRDAVFFSTVHEVSDVLDPSEQKRSRDEHEELTNQIEQAMKAEGLAPFRLSGDSCSVCDKCSYPDGSCRFPERMHPCIESYGIVVANLVETCKMDYYIGGQELLWFSLIYI